MAYYYENRGTLRELSRMPLASNYSLYTSTRNVPARDKDVTYVYAGSLSEPIQVYVDNLFWKNTTVCFMVRGWTANSGSAKKILMSYVDAEGKNYFEIYTRNSKYYLASQMVEIDISAFHFTGSTAGHMFTATRDWDNGIIRVWEDKTQILAAYFTDTDFALSNEPNTAVLANEAETAIIVMEPSIVNRGALNRNINLYLYGSAAEGISYTYGGPYIGDFHIWDWAIEQDDVEEIYDNSTLTMSVDRLTRYLGEFKEVPTLARLGDSFMWVGVSGDLFQNGKVYWLTAGGWSILNNNAEYSAT